MAKKAAKGKKKETKATKAKPKPVPIPVEPPKPNPCEIECPLYFVLEIRKCLWSPKYDEQTGVNNNFLYFKTAENVAELFDELKQAREEQQRAHNALIEEITLEFFEPSYVDAKQPIGFTLPICEYKKI